MDGDRPLAARRNAAQFGGQNKNNFNLLRIGTYCFALQIELHSDMLQGVY